MISTHVLDLNLGQPAREVVVRLEKKSGPNWALVDSQRTNGDGRVSFKCPNEAGIYRIHFGIEDYFKSLKMTPFFLAAPIEFEIRDVQRKYHIPLLVSPFGFSTYRGT